MDVLSSLKSMPMASQGPAAGGKKDPLASSTLTPQSKSTSPDEKSFSSHLRQPQDSYRPDRNLNKQETPRQEQAPGQKVVQDEIQQKNVEQSPVKRKEETLDSIPRRIALQTFVRKMKDEVGVDAHDIMKAFASLEPQELALPPEQNLEKILSQLELDGDQKVKAHTLFENLMKQTASNSLADHLKSSGRQLSMEVLSTRELRDQKLKESLAQLNQSFFVDPQMQKSAQAANTEGQSEAEEENGAGFFSAGNMTGLIGTGSALGAAAAAAASASAGEASKGASQAGVSSLNTSSVEGIELPDGMTEVEPANWSENFSSLEEEASTTSTISETEVLENNLSEKVAIEPKKVQAHKSLEEQLRGFKLESSMNKPVISKQAQAAYEMSPKNLMTQSSNGMNSTASTAAAGLGAAIGGISLMAGGGDETSSEQSMDEGMLQGQGFDIQNQGKDMKLAQAPKFELSMQPTEQQEASNIKELINQAQFLSKKGGGEMKIALNPEGLGEIQMKVAVQNGEVNVEMLAESSEAKKLLEKGLGELKSSLASHKLNVENIKVDFQGEISKHLDDQQREAERNFQQQFLENFRQENGGFRRSFGDPGGISLGKDKEGEESDRLQTQSVKPKRSDKRLDLVA